MKLYTVAVDGLRLWMKGDYFKGDNKLFRMRGISLFVN